MSSTVQKFKRSTVEFKFDKRSLFAKDHLRLRGIDVELLNGASPRAVEPLNVEWGRSAKRLLPIVLFFLFAANAHAAIKYVGTSGTDSGRNCSNDTTQLCRTIDKGISVLSGGDTLEILDGSYAELIDTATTRDIPNGTLGAETIIKARNRGAVNMTGVTPGALAEAMFFLRDGKDNIIIDGIILNGSNGSTKSGFAFGGSDGGSEAHHIELRYYRATQFRQQGIIFSHAPTNGVFHLHHGRSDNNGTDCTGFALGPGHCHGLYLNGVPNSIIEDNEFDHNEGFGVHMYSEPAQNDNVIVRRNVSHHNGIGGAAGQKNAAGFILGSGTNILAYNNISYSNTGGGILAQYGAVSPKIYNNTIVGNGGSGTDGNLGCFFYASGSSGAQFIGNACSGNTGTAIQDSIGDLVQSGNVTSGSFNFVNAGANDYRIGSGSALIGAGVQSNSLFTDDYALITRGSTWDSGAYQFAAGSPVATITGPTTNPVHTTSSSTITLTGSATDDVSVSSVTWANNRGGSGTASGTTSWSTGSISLSIGANIITVTAHDGASQTGMDVITVTYYPAFTSIGLIGCWSFDEGSGSTATDCSGRGHTATLSGSATWADGKYGKALSLNGTTALATVADAADLDFQNALTITAYVKPTDSLTDFRAVLVKGYKYGLYNSVTAYCGAGNPIGFVYMNADTDLGTVCSGPNVQINVWSHLAFRYNNDAATLDLFVNKVLLATATVSGQILPSTGTLTFGASQFGEFFKGLIDHVKVYDRAIPLTNGAGDVCGAGSDSITKDSDCAVNPAPVPGVPQIISIGSNTISIGNKALSFGIAQ